MIKLFSVAMLSIASFSSFAAIQCGGFRMTGDGMTIINGDTVTSQKVKFLGKNGDYANMMMDMTLMPASDGNNYGFQFIKRDGKAWLNVQLLQASMDAPKIIGSFPCKKVPD